MLLHDQLISLISNCRKILAAFLIEKAKFKPNPTFISTEKNPIKLHASTFPNILQQFPNKR